MSLNYASIPEHVVCERVIKAFKAAEVNWFRITHAFANLMIRLNS